MSRFVSGSNAAVDFVSDFVAGMRPNLKRSTSAAKSTPELLSSVDEAFDPVAAANLVRQEFNANLGRAPTRYTTPPPRADYSGMSPMEPLNLNPAAIGDSAEGYVSPLGVPPNPLGRPSKQEPTFNLPPIDPGVAGAQRVAKDYSENLPDELIKDLRKEQFAQEHSLYSMHEPMLRGSGGDVKAIGAANRAGVAVEPITSSEQAQNIAQLISSRIGNVSNAPMGELKTLSTAERLASEKGASAASFDDMVKARDLGNQARLRREELLSGADVDNVNINSQMSPMNNNFDASLRELKVSELVGMEDIAGVTSQKRFGELTTGMDPIKGYDEVAHNATNANVVEEVAGVTNPDKGLFGIYDPTKDPTKVGGIFGSMAGTSASGVLGSIGVGATVGGVGAYMTGGEFSEGAAAGGIMGLGLRGISGAINANAMGIQRGMYKNILGDAYDPKMNQEAMSNALRGVDKESLNIGQKGMYSVLANPNKSSVGFSLRAQTLTGGFLAGSMFSSRRSDKRRGFNAHRGNRI